MSRVFADEPSSLFAVDLSSVLIEILDKSRVFISQNLEHITPIDDELILITPKPNDEKMCLAGREPASRKVFVLACFDHSLALIHCFVRNQYLRISRFCSLMHALVSTAEVTVAIKLPCFFCVLFPSSPPFCWLSPAQ